MVKIFGVAYLLDRVEGQAAAIFLTVDFAVTIDLGSHVVAQRINAADADAVQTTGDFI